MGYSRQEYVESDTVKKAQAAVTQKESEKPGAYVSQYRQQLEALLNQYTGRGAFQYDLSSDVLYGQYRQQAVQQGRLAMQDTIGQAAALTGGYGNSYAQTVGQQTYQGYLQSLNDRIPELYRLALERYEQEGESLSEQYAMVNALEESDYGRYRDSVSDYQEELKRLQDAAQQEREFDYGIYQDRETAAYTQYRDEVKDSQWLQSFLYQKERDAVSDAQFQQKLALQTASQRSGVADYDYGRYNGPTNSQELSDDLAAYRKQAQAAGMSQAEIQKKVNLLAGEYYQQYGKYK